MGVIAVRIRPDAARIPTGISAAPLRPSFAKLPYFPPRYCETLVIR